tara:strand:- start:1487 stop:1828 length:342 start_codon:yes stop_codon:yes gene_type:complete
MQFKKLIYTSLCLLLFNTISIAETIDKNEFSETQAVIESQLKAFINKDAEGAFFHASPYIKMRFNNPQDFMSMVKNIMSLFITLKITILWNQNFLKELYIINYKSSRKIMFLI